MCMEDIRIARRSWVQQTTLTVGADGTYHLPADYKRVSLMVQSSQTGVPIYVYLGNRTASQLNGPIWAWLSSSQQNRWLTIHDAGQAVMSDLTIVDPNAGNTELTATCILLTEE